MKLNEIKQFLQCAYRDVIENMGDWEDHLPHYFSSDYVQYIDGDVHNLSESIEHIRQIKESIARVYFEFAHLVAEENKIFSIHYAYVTKKDGSRFKLKGIALFEMHDGKFISCDELTRELPW